MKAREVYEQIRNQRSKFSLRIGLTLLVSLYIIICVLIAFCAWLLLGGYLIKIDSNLLLILNLIGSSLLIGFIVAGFLSKWFFIPVNNLRQGMGEIADGHFDTRLCTEADFKEIRELYSGFNLMAQELQSTEMLQTDFVSNVSHEFKTPINAIEGYSTLLQGCENLDEDQKQYVDKILFNTKRLSTLVGNILLLSTVENQDIQSNQTRFRLDEQIRQTIVALEPAWTEKSVQFDVDMESITYICNENLMHHVWSNLIGNAIKFGPFGGEIKIRLTKQKEGILFTVEDNGPGLSEEAKKHLFDKFYQADSSHKQEGNGLGLALVKRIVAIVGGEVFAENIKTGGCRFTVKLKA
ncbi:MAG: HAMP domain-containing histidine kinase [Firmicutes bacterium]|nr:HAMP domain-containing histidine kinase [Bacillota bacterium]